MRKMPATPQVDTKATAALQSKLTAAEKHISSLEQAASQHQAALDASERKRQAVIRVLDQKVRERKALEEKLKEATGKGTSKLLPFESLSPRPGLVDIPRNVDIKKKS